VVSEARSTHPRTEKNPGTREGRNHVGFTSKTGREVGWPRSGQGALDMVAERGGPGSIPDGGKG